MGCLQSGLMSKFRLPLVINWQCNVLAHKMPEVITSGSKQVEYHLSNPSTVSLFLWSNPVQAFEL